MRINRTTRALLAAAGLAAATVAGVVVVSHGSSASPPTAPAAAAAKSGFTLTAANNNLNVPAGTQASDAITVTRTAFTGAITFSVTGLPTGATATFVPNPTSTTGTSSTLQIVTSSSTPNGSNTLTVTGASGSVTATTTIHLAVSAGQSSQFTISGTLDRQLLPGVTGLLNLALTNPNNQPMNVSNLTVTVAQVNKAGCSPTSDFLVTQYSGTSPLTVPANSTKTLLQLGVAQANWPKVTMIDRPVNQDACKNATLTLSFTGSGAGN